MKYLCILFALLPITNRIFAQQKQNTFNNKDKAQQNNNTGSGKQSINNYSYFTINNNNNNRLSSKDNAINATTGFFKTVKIDRTSNGWLKFGGVLMTKVVHGNIGFGSDPISPILVKKLNSKLNISAIIRDSNGDEIASISGNTWQITNSQNIQYNNDSKGLEIITGRRVIFQLNIVKDTVICYGMFCSEEGICIYADSTGNVYTPIKNIRLTQRFVLPPGLIIRPLFKYPRFKYLGVRDK